jgi:putative tryptophan/tyrosine transport system substrate-binding protein
MRVFRFGAAIATTMLLTSTVQAADVAILKSGDVPAWRPAIDALRRAAPAHTIVELDFKNDRAEGERLLAGLAGRSLIVVAMGPLAAKLAHELKPEAPLVFCMIANPEAEGLAVAPGIAGVSFETPIRNQLAAFRQIYPKTAKLGVIYTEAESGKLIQDAIKSAPLMRIILVPHAVTSEAEIAPALRDMLNGEDAVDALWVPPDTLLQRDEPRRVLLAETQKQGKPVFASSSSLVEEGALASDGPQYASIGEQAASLVNRLASGEKTTIDLLAPLPELWVNEKIAKKLKIELPKDLLKGSTHVVRQ